jgi:tetratricopeptide (TPR) repeat protein
MRIYASALFLLGFVLRAQAVDLSADPATRASQLNNLGSIEYGQGRYSEAEAHLLESRNLARTTQSVGILEATASAINLAAVYEAEFRLNEAASLYREALDARTGATGPADPSLLHPLIGLSQVLRDEGNYAEAEELSRRALSIGETVPALDSLALALWAEGKLGEAGAVARRAVALAVPDSIESARERITCGLIEKSAGRYITAAAAYSQALVIFNRQSGPDSPESAAAKEDLGQALLAEGHLTEGRVALEQGLATLQDVYGRNHPRVAMALSNLGASYAARKNYARAETLYRQALAIDLDRLGPDSLRAAEDLTNAGSMAFHRGHYAQSESLLFRAVAIYRNDGNQPGPMSLALGNLGVVYGKENILDRAGAAYREAIESGRKAWDKDDPRLANLLSGYSEVLRADRNFSEAERVAAAATEISVRDVLKRNKAQTLFAQ